MKSLVVYFSRTGTTKKIAEEIAEKLKADVERVIDKKSRGGMIGWILAGRDGMKRELTQINKIEKDPEDYDLVVIGTPIWVNTTPAIRTYLKENKDKFKKVAFFCTMGGSGSKDVFMEMEKITGMKPLSKMALRRDDVEGGFYEDDMREFVEKIS